MLKSSYTQGILEAGCDEAGRGCLAGPVFAAAVILPDGYSNPHLNDSKKLNESARNQLRKIIMKDALAYAIGMCDNHEIDSMNILNASFMAMHRAIEKLKIRPELLLIDGNRFRPFPGIRHQCIIKGDGIYMSVAAASILAKTARDEYMVLQHENYPEYNWLNNKGYPTTEHRKAIFAYGLTPLHRLTFNVQLSLFDEQK